MTPSAGRRFWDATVVLSTAAAAWRDGKQMTEPYDGDAFDMTFFVSCYNEAPYILETLETVRASASELGLRYEVIVIDDGSKDNSCELVAGYIAAHPEDQLVLRANAQNKGLAQNYVDGAFLGRGRYYRLICGDNGEPKESIVSVLRAVGTADIVVPYYLDVEGKGLKRQIISGTYTWLINAITGNRLHYYNGLAVHLRYNVMRWHSNTRGFGFQADTLCMLIDLGFTYVEMPIIASEQRKGVSNALTFRNLLSVAHTVAGIMVRRVANRVHRRR